MDRARSANTLALYFLLAALAIAAAPLAHAQEWQLTDGAARDVGVGADGTVWVIGTNSVPGGYGIYKRANNAWVNVPGGAERIAVDPQGNAWVVNNSQTIFRHDGSQWVTVNGAARDVGVGANGTVWVIGNNEEAGGYGIYRSTDQGANWTKVPGSALRVSVDPQGNAWVVNKANAIFRFDGSQWVTLPGQATDVGIGADGAAWVIGVDSGIYRWEGSDWAKKPGGAAQIAAGPGGAVWVVNQGNQIYHAGAPAVGQVVAVPPPAEPKHPKRKNDPQKPPQTIPVPVKPEPVKPGVIQKPAPALPVPEKPSTESQPAPQPQPAPASTAAAAEPAPAQPTAAQSEPIQFPPPNLYIAAPGDTSAVNWARTDGAAHDIAVGANGTVWAIGADKVPGGFGIYRRENSSWVNVPGGAERIAVDPQGNAWVVNDSRTLFRHDGKAWVTLGQRARDVGVGANGTAWVIGNNEEAGGYGIYRSTDKGASWNKVPGSALRVSVDPQGNAWVVNKTRNVFRFDGSQWVTLPGAATDIAVGADGVAWAIGADGGIYRWEGSDWAKKPGGAAQIAAGPNGAVWVVNQAKEIYQAQVAPAASTPSSPTSGPIVVTMTGPSIPIATSPPSGPSGQVPLPGTSTSTSGTLVIGSGSPAAPAAPAPPAVHDPSAPWKVFARGHTYEAQILQAIGFQRFKYQIFLENSIPRAGQLSPLEQAVAEIALSATESYFAANPLAPGQAIAKVKSDVTARRGVITFIGMGISARVRTTSNDPRAVALRQWAAEVYRMIQIATAKGVLDEYNRWKRDPCGYENLPAVRCQGYASMISPPRPSRELIEKNGLGAALATTADEVASAAAIGFAVAGLGASAAALATGLGVTAVAGATFGTATVVPAITTSLFAAFGGVAGTATGVSSASASAAAGAIGGVSWAGVVAAPIAAAVAVVVVGTVEGFAVVEAARVEPMMKLKLGAAMTENINIQNELATDAGKDFFFLAYESAAANGFTIPPNTVDGEVRFYCQAGFVSRFKLTYTLDGTTHTKTTRDLPVGHEQSFAIPARATNIVASGEWSNGSSWQSLFSRNLARPTFVGFTSYGTIFGPAVKDEYPEISNIQGAANKLTVTQGGGYVAWIRVEYSQGGKSVRVVEVKEAPIGWRKEVDLPSDATNIHLVAWSSTGLAWEPWKTIIDKTWPTPQAVCIKLYHTSLDPKWNNECK